MDLFQLSLLFVYKSQQRQNQIELKNDSPFFLGMGFVGFPLLLLLAKSNQETIGVDTSETLIQKLKKGIIPYHI